MHGLSTSTGRDAWLAMLIDGFDAASHRATPVTARMRADVERHLRDNSRANAVGSRLFH